MKVFGCNITSEIWTLSLCPGSHCRPAGACQTCTWPGPSRRGHPQLWAFGTAVPQDRAGQHSSAVSSSQCQVLQWTLWNKLKLTWKACCIFCCWVWWAEGCASVGVGGEQAGTWAVARLCRTCCCAKDWWKICCWWAATCRVVAAPPLFVFFDCCAPKGAGLLERTLPLAVPVT